MAFDEDLSSFLDTANGFAISATVGGVSVTGIFDGGFAGNSASTFGVESSSPSFTCQAADLPTGADEGTSVIIGGDNYKIKDLEPDGLGMITLTLYKTTQDDPGTVPSTGGIEIVESDW